MAYGDTLEATARAAAEHWWGIDKNMLSTIDLVAVIVHSAQLDSFLGGKLTHQWTGAAWGEGDLAPDPHPALTVGERKWAEVSRMTDATGSRRIRTAREHAEDGVAKGVVQMFEAKGSALLDLPAFWSRLGAELDAVGHPRVMMTLTGIGSPVRRLIAAKGAGFQTAILPRNARPADYLTRWAPHIDRVWGDAWNPIPT